MKKFLSNILVMGLLIILAFVIYAKFIKKDKMINLFGYQFLIVLSGSMEPEIQTGSLIVIKEKPEYQIGDIVTYSEEEYLVTHRITQEIDDKIVTKGDNNNEKDEEIDQSKIFGKVIYHSFFLGKLIQDYLKYIFITVTSIVILWNLYWKWKERKKNGEVQENSK